MKYEITREENGKVILKLGLHNEIVFQEGDSPDVIVSGVDALIKQTVAISPFELAEAVAKELGLVDGE